MHSFTVVTFSPEVALHGFESPKEEYILIPGSWLILCRLGAQEVNIGAKIKFHLTNGIFSQLLDSCNKHFKVPIFFLTIFEPQVVTVINCGFFSPP